MKTIEQINEDILELRHSGQSVKKVSDGYHTFGDYTDMRNVYFIALCNAYPDISWKSKKHFDEENDPMYPEAIRLINFLRTLLPIPSDEIPIDSVLREFIGGSCFY